MSACMRARAMLVCVCARALTYSCIQTGEEATNYLNARVNSEVKGLDKPDKGYSQEAANEAVGVFACLSVVRRVCCMYAVSLGIAG